VRRLGLLAMLALAAAAGCAAGNDAGSPNGGTGGTGGSSASGGRGGGGGSFTGGSSGGASAGSGGSSATGGSGVSTGGTGAGGAAPDASASDGAQGTGGSGGAGGSSGADAAADVPATAACTVTMAPLLPQRWEGLPATPGSRLRVGATATGYAVPAKPSFLWQVSYNNSQNIPVTVVAGDPAVVEFPTEMVGQYVVSVTVFGVIPPCSSGPRTASAQPLNNLVARYRIRATAPATRGLAPLEVDLPVSFGSTPMKSLELGRGREVTVDAKDALDALHPELPAYLVQLRARNATTRLEGFVDTTVGDRPVSGFHTRLDESQPVLYDLLVIPVPGTTAGVRAPRLYAGITAAQFSVQDFALDRGTLVSGTVSVAGVPLASARVRLRDGLLTSTIGDSNPAGGYELRVRAGRFEIRVSPPPASGLPEAQLPESAGLIIPPGAAGIQADFRYGELPLSRLDLTITGPGSGPAVGPLEVLLQSLEGELANVGSFALPGGEVAAAGAVRISRSAPGNTVSFDRLPRARYRVTVVPPAQTAGAAITSAELDLRSAGNTVAQTVPLATRIPLRGRLTDLTISGLKVRAADAGEDGFRRTVLVNVGADGSYEIPADPGRLYRLSVEPTVDRSIPRFPLIPVRASAGAPVNSVRLPRPLTVTGFARGEGTPLPGAVIQIFCLGSAPDCVAEESPDVSNTLPIDETVSGPDGSYTLKVPEPN
jgi:hypothetical protein